MNYSNPHPTGCPWHNVAEAFGAPNVKWCEETLCSWISEPANTWSNLGFLLAGLLLVRLARGRKEVRGLGLSVVFMGSMSLAYHAGNVFPLQWLDFVGMFVALGFILGRHFSTPWPGVALVVVFSAAVFPMYKFELPYQALVAVLTLPALALEFRLALQRKNSLRFLVLSTALFLVAFVASWVDHSRLWCAPSQHVIHGHAVWHVFAAAGFYFLGRQWLQSY